MTVFSKIRKERPICSIRSAHTHHTVSLFDGTIATAFIIIAGKDAILVVHNRSHQVTFTIGIDHTLLLYHEMCIRDSARTWQTMSWHK